MSGFATAGLAAFDSLKTRAAQKISGISRRPKGDGGYEEFQQPSEHVKVNKGFEDERGRLSGAGSLDSLQEPERPPLRHVDTYCRPEIPCLSKRYTVALLACIGFIISFGMRCNMSMAKLKLSKRHNWTVATESAVDSSFFWGYLVTQVPGGFLASLYPANRIFGTAIVISSFLNLLGPGAVEISPILYMMVQVCKGLVEGVTYPACHGIWKYWAPPLERSRLATLAFCGSYAALVIGLPVSGFLDTNFGWSASFYFYGCIGIIWYCIWLWLAFEKPSLHPCISMKELRYIEDSLGQSQSNLPMPTFATTPWRKFFTSMPVYAIIVANFCRSWNFYLLVLFQVRFMKETFKMSALETGVLGSLPHLLMTLIVPIGGQLADYLRKSGTMTTTNVRKLFNCGGFGMEALSFLWVAYSASEQDSVSATTALTIGVAFSGFAISGFNVNHLDIAPRYASILMGMSNGVGTVAGLFVPIFVDHITSDKRALSWRVVFIIAACVHFCGVIFYFFFCSGELQSWADPSAEEKASWNPLDDLAHTRPPVPPQPKVMQTQFIKQPSLGDNPQPVGWNYEQQPYQQSGQYEPPGVPQYQSASNEYQQQHEPIDRGQTVSYGAIENASSNPFVSTNPFASGAMNESYIQPAAKDDYTHDVMKDQQQWQ